MTKDCSYKGGMWQKRLSILLTSLICHRRICICLLSHSSSHRMRPLVVCTFKAFLRLLDIEFHSFDHGHLIWCWPNLTIFYQGMVVLSLLANKPVSFENRVQPQSCGFFIQPINQVLIKWQGLNVITVEMEFLSILYEIHSHFHFPRLCPYDAAVTRLNFTHCYRS